MSRLVSQAPRTAGFWLGLDKGWCQGEMEGCVPERKVFLLFFFRLCLQQLLVSSVGSILTGSESRFSNNPGFWALAELSVPFVFFILRVVVAWLPLLQLIWLLNPSSTCVKNCLHWIPFISNICKVFMFAWLNPKGDTCPPLNQLLTTRICSPGLDQTWRFDPHSGIRTYHFFHIFVWITSKDGASICKDEGGQFVLYGLWRLLYFFSKILCM